jgi:hypothetical protein
MFVTDEVVAPAVRAGDLNARAVLRSAKLPNQIQIITAHEKQPGRWAARFMCKRNLVITDDRGAVSFKSVSNGHPTWFVPSVREARNIREAMSELREAARDPYACMVQACLNDEDERVAAAFIKDGYIRRVCKEDIAAGKLPYLGSRKTHLHMIDSDLLTDEQRAFCRDNGLDFIKDTKPAITTFVARFLPPKFQEITYGYHLSATGGIALKKSSKDTDPRVIDPSVGKFHLFVWLETPMTPQEFKGWLIDSRCDVDTAVNADVQPHYIGVRFEDADGNIVTDPFERQRWGIIEGKRETLDLEIAPRDRDIFSHDGRSVQKTNRREQCYITTVDGKEHAIPVSNAKRYKRLNWRERLALMKAGDVHISLLEVTMGLARELHAQHDGNIPPACVRIGLEEIRAAITSAYAGSPKDIREHQQALWGIYQGAARIVARKAEELERARAVRVQALYPDTRITLAEAEKRRDEILDDWFGRAERCMRAAEANCSCAMI